MRRPEDSFFSLACADCAVCVTGATTVPAHDPSKKPEKSILKSSGAGETAAPAGGAGGAAEAAGGASGEKPKWRQDSEKMREMMRRARAAKVATSCWLSLTALMHGLAVFLFRHRVRCPEPAAQALTLFACQGSGGEAHFVEKLEFARNFSCLLGHGHITIRVRLRS